MKLGFFLPVFALTITKDGHAPYFTIFDIDYHLVP